MSKNINTKSNVNCCQSTKTHFTLVSKLIWAHPDVLTCFELHILKYICLIFFTLFKN